MINLFVGNNYVLGMDIGGSHVTAGLVDLDNKRIIPDSLRRVDLDSQGPTEEILNVWRGIVESCYTDYKDMPKYIGLAMPGPCDYEQGICYIDGLSKYSNLYGLNVCQGLARALKIPEENIRMTNDAACFLQGELDMGVGRKYQNPIGITLGTGCGTAKIRHGIGVDGALWQHPFKGGIVEDFISTKWFNQRYAELTGQEIHGVKDLTEKNNSEPLVKSVFEEFAFNLAEFIHFFVSKENPDAIILGGNMLKAQHIFLPKVQTELTKTGIMEPIHLSNLGESAAILGAASAYVKKKMYLKTKIA
ncbi:MAG: ROK family protein [Cyclobacteriaceae bacterium]